jgi:hypothetical protein
MERSAVVRKSQYCSYSHYSADLQRAQPECFIAMFTAYFDDSGTDNNSEIAIAACYISTKRGWDDFVKAWDFARCEEGFDAFHMAHFVAKRDQQHEPFCHWDNAKKSHVYGRLSKIVNENKRVGIASAVPKDVWDRTPERIRQHFGREHYTYAVRMCMMRIAEWRKKSLISLPIQYVFDWEMKTAQKRKEISLIFDILTADEHAAQVFGLEPQGYSFQHKEVFKPLQAADILAWQMRCHMDKIFPLGHDDVSLCHPGFRVLRENQEVDLGFFTEDQIAKFVKQNDELEAAMGPLPVLYP